MNFRSALRFIGAGVCAMALTGVAWAKVDINHATAEQLQALHGVGPVRAQAIIAERRAHGPFKSKADIASRVHGIGPETVNGFAAEIEFGPSGSAAAKPAPAAAASKAASPMPSPAAVKTPSSGAAATHPAATTAPHPAHTPAPAAGASSTPSQKTSQTSSRKAIPSPTSTPSGTPK